MDTTLFLGPPLGETILLEDGEGAVTRRTCTAISEEGVYSIEERTRFLTGNVTEENIAKNKLSEKVVRIIRGEEDLVNNYTLQAKDGKIILHNTTFDKTDIMLDFTSRKWVIYGRSTHGKIKMECRIVREKEDFIRGKKRKLIYVEMYSKLNNEPFVDAYTIASGLGIIYSESVSYGKTFVLYSLKDK
ncbi:hypothetical protein [Maridesulfovibrio ferrireducens]|uniref:hypothetical protein n=1 Tax=Maridesulfovibrio ferrireducens TaxID=246191 RepID=UPI001A22FF34|nr:hypothetical protein [Maridesulfovibrio ferrireducens]MBI9111361.1 hypothetical protein [Maridesulfovibrio ferrireducens]